MRRSNTVSALMLVGALALPAVSYAQSSNMVDDQNVVTNTDRDNDGDNWGWLGLLGLAGLLGLKRRDSDKQRDHMPTRQPI